MVDPTVLHALVSIYYAKTGVSSVLHPSLASQGKGGSMAGPKEEIKLQDRVSTSENRLKCN